jgi:glycerol uptake facilitator-like aquaporin
MFLGFLIEAICFCVFMLLIFKVNHFSKNKYVIDIILGAGLTIIIVIEIPFTGASLNAARSIGPVLFGS